MAQITVHRVPEDTEHSVRLRGRRCLPAQQRGDHLAGQQQQPPEVGGQEQSVREPP